MGTRPHRPRELSVLDWDHDLPEPYHTSFMNALEQVSPRQKMLAEPEPVLHPQGPWWVEILWRDIDNHWIRSFSHKHLLKFGYPTLQAAHKFAAQLTNNVSFFAMLDDEKFRIHFAYHEGGPPPPVVSTIEHYDLGGDDAQRA